MPSLWIRPAAAAAPLAAVVALSLAGSGAHAGGTYTLIPSYSGPSGATTSVLSLNNSGAMTGSVNYLDGTSDGFSRSASGVYSLFNDGYATQGRNISNSGSITGYATIDSTLNLRTATEFLRSSGGALQTLVDPNTSAPLHGIAQGQNDFGAIAGDYYFGANYRHGYILNGASFTDISYAPAPYQHTIARGINDAGVIIGSAIDNMSGITEGFIDVGGSFSFYADPSPLNAATTYFSAINNLGLIAGGFVDASGNNYSFLFNRYTDVFTDLTPPGSAYYQTFGVNDLGQVVLTGSDGSNYLYTPVPEPAAWATVLLGFGLVGGLARRRSAKAVAAAL